MNCPAIVRDAAVRGLKVTRAERANLAWGLSRVCSALLHGGLRYLGHLVFRLVRQSLNERQATGRVIAGILRISIQGGLGDEALRGGDRRGLRPTCLRKADDTFEERPVVLIGVESRDDRTQ